MQPNQTIQNYKLVRKLGEGGMGEVWLAEHLHMNRQVAIKALHSQFARNENIRKRFKQAVEVLSRLDHPGIVRVFDMVVTEDHLLMVMEYVDGMTLDEMIHNVTGPMSEEQLRKLFPQMVQAIGYAHKHGVVHRDIKPSNFIVTRDGKVKVFDFDIAKLMDDQGQNLTKTGMRMGTLYYMSPEQVRGEKLDQRTDIYSLGMTLYVMATGKSPYAHIHSEFEVQTAIVNRPVPLPRSVYPGVSPAMEQMILRAIEKDPSRRLQTCEAFLSVNGGGDPQTQIPYNSGGKDTSNANWDQLSNPERDELAWKIAAANNTPWYYRKYLEYFPNGKYATLARTRRNNLIVNQIALIAAISIGLIIFLNMVS